MHAALRKTRLTIVVFNTLMDALSEPPASDLDARARTVARSLAETAAATRGWAEVAWVPAPRVCAAAPGWAIKHFGLPPSAPPAPRVGLRAPHAPPTHKVLGRRAQRAHRAP